MMDRDAILRISATKRIKSVTRYPWDILAKSNSDAATQQREDLLRFFSSLSVTDLIGWSQVSGMPLLVTRILDCIGYKYSVIRIDFEEKDGKVVGHATSIPIWCCKSVDNVLYFCPPGTDVNQKVDMSNHVVGQSEGLMLSCSRLVLYHFNTLTAWNEYVSILGKPTAVGLCNGVQNSAEWLYLKEAVDTFNDGRNVVIPTADELKSVTRASGTSNVSYSEYYRELEENIITLWRGGNLSTRSSEYSTGASLQSRELGLLEVDDCNLVSEIINSQLIPMYLRHIGSPEVLCEFVITSVIRSEVSTDLSIDRFLYLTGVATSQTELLNRYNRSAPITTEDVFVKTDDVQGIKTDVLSKDL